MQTLRKVDRWIADHFAHLLWALDSVGLSFVTYIGYMMFRDLLRSFRSEDL